MTAEALVSQCHSLGVLLAVSPEGKLRATPPGRLPGALKETLKQRKAEVLALLTTWTCRHCSQPLTIDDVCPSLDGERMLTLWRCDPCQVAGVTPDAIKKPPTVWVKTIKQ